MCFDAVSEIYCFCHFGIVERVEESKEGRLVDEMPGRDRMKEERER